MINKSTRFLLWDCIILLSFLSGSLARDQYLLFDGFDDGSSVTVEANTPDTTSLLLGGATRVCYHGCWVAYESKGYQNIGGFGALFCVEASGCINVAGFPYLSLRHVGAADMNTEAVTLYPSEDYVGSEMLITDSSFDGILPPQKSLGVTGKSQWTFYEGTNFNGASFCIEVPKYGISAWSFPVGLKGIGSGRRGPCSNPV